MRKLLWAVVAVVVIGMASSVRAVEAGDDPAKVRRIPGPGMALTVEQRAGLEIGVEALGREIAALKTELKDKKEMLELLPDVEIYYNAVHYALKYDEFFGPREFGKPGAPAKDVAAAKEAALKREAATATKLLDTGMERAKALRAGNAPWNTAIGPVARGYVSKIDGSVQPYVLVVPETYDPKAQHPWRLDVWYHGRGEDLSEIKFLQTQKGEFPLKDGFVLLPYGRYCNANKFAGEVDTFEALDNIKKHYTIDDNRISVRGFSMGGASTWQIATHFPGMWAATNPGAGFAETPEFTHVFDPKNTGPKPTDFEQKLWHIYDSTHYAENLFNLPTVAYSGELDGQKQAADIMAKTLKNYNMELKHVIGPGVQHKYEPKAKEEVAKLVDEIVAKGRQVPTHIKFTTYTLRYNQAFWVTIVALDEHWIKARIEAEFVGKDLKITTTNIARLTLDLSAKELHVKHFGEHDGTVITIDGQTMDRGAYGFEEFDKINGKWDRHFTLQTAGDEASQKAFWEKHWKQEKAAEAFKKRHGIQGPIDDAFMDSFVMVAPTGTPITEKAGAFVKAEMAHAVEHWRRQFRGEARVVNDNQVSDDMIANSNLVLWGDPSSNKILAKIIDKLPLKWDAKSVTIGAATFPAEQHVPLLIFPNPLNTEKYVVLNSGFTFRENEYLNNAKQNAKLPDWAIIDVSEPATARWPGKVVAADFFDEHWAVKK